MKLNVRTNVCLRAPRDHRAFGDESVCPTNVTTTWTKRALALGVAAHMPAAVRGNQTPTIAFDGVRRSPEHPR